MKKLISAIIAALLCLPAVKAGDDARMGWWRDARFGMFIHWGLYSAAAGEWNGKPVEGIGEWLQCYASVPNSEYNTLTSKMTLKNYSPEKWVKMAKDAGVKYIVLTAKHHEGFCMYPSAISDFNIRLTGYKGDPVRELIDECRRQDMKVGLYYSHRLDWHEEDAAFMHNEYDGHYGKPKSEVKGNLDKYIKEKALPQVREILTNYGKIDVIWFDTPYDIKPEQCKQFVNLVRELQPDCIINGRVGFDLGDYGALGDNEMPCANATKDLEMVATMNYTWGFKKQDKDWKSKKDLLCSVIESASRGVNYMLNVGPREDGVIPRESEVILEYIGRWMKRNGESVYGAGPNPFSDNFPWGYATRKGNQLYLQMYQSPRNNRIVLRGLLSPVEKAVILADKRELKVDSRPDGSVEISIPDGLNFYEVPVVRITCQGDVKTDGKNYDNEGIISMPAAYAERKPGKGGEITLGEGGYTDNFNPATGSITFRFNVLTPGDYDIRLCTSRHWRRSFLKDAYVTLAPDNRKAEKILLTEGEMYRNVRSKSYPESWSYLTTLSFKEPGEHTLTLAVDKSGTFTSTGFYGEDTEGESDNNIRVMRLEAHLVGTPQMHADIKALRKKFPLPEAKASNYELSNSMEVLADLNWSNPEGFSRFEVRKLAVALRAMAFAANDNLPECADFESTVDKMVSTGLLGKVEKFRFSSYDDVRKIPADMLAAVPVLDKKRAAALIAEIKKIIEFDRTLMTPVEINKNTNSDYIYNALPHIFLLALHNPDEDQAVKDMMAVSDYISRCAAYTPGSLDILKPDGTGFHHKTHYNGYMYSYQTWVKYVHALHGTAFHVTEDAYRHIAKAVVSAYLMATTGDNDKNHNYATALSGRHPFDGNNVSFNRDLVKKLAEAGSDFCDGKYDPELAAYYNAFFRSGFYSDVQPRNLDGFYQFNFSPIGVYRKDNWVATMRCPTSRFWGGELYDKTNRFGRYQSHGTLEVLYDGDLESSGYMYYPNSKSTEVGGWDWRMMPGATTVLYTDWKAMLPNGNDKDRFDQRSKDTDFAGALAWGDCGMFAADFVQSDTWGSRRFTPTELTFRKSVFAFDGILLSLGSAISAKADYPDEWITATTLFQSIDKSRRNDPVVNGKAIAKGETLSLGGDSDSWLLSPHSTGFFIPRGNDPVTVTFDDQTTPSPKGLQNGKMGTTTAVKAYINHGAKPEGKSYVFAVVPATNAEAMAQTAARLAAGDLFSIDCQTDSMHIVTHKPSGTIAYTLFKASGNLSRGTVKAVSAPLLLMERAQGGNALDLAVCDPNLHPEAEKDYEWVATPQTVTIRLEGQWKPDQATEGLLCGYSADAAGTTMSVTLADGMPAYLKFTK